MGKEERVAFINAQTACALAEIAAMQAENTQRAIEGYSPAYNYDAFMQVQNTYLISWNAVIEYLRN